VLLQHVGEGCMHFAESKSRFWEKDVCKAGGRHYSDRLCSDRRYSDNPQSGRPSTSLACLSICRNSRNWDKIGGGRGVACIESTSLIQAPRWPRGVGSGESGGYSGEVCCAPLHRKSYNLPPRLNTIVLPPTPDFRDLVRCLSYRYCPQAYSTAVSHPMSTSRLWIVGMSVGTESVVIAWCTRARHGCSRLVNRVLTTPENLENSANFKFTRGIFESVIVGIKFCV